MEHKAFYALAPSHLLRTKLSLLSLFFLPSFCILGSMGILEFPEQLGYFSLFFPTIVRLLPLHRILPLTPIYLVNTPIVSQESIQGFTDLVFLHLPE